MLVAAIAAVLVVASPAVADDTEGSFHLEISPRLARTEDARERGDFATMPGLAVGVRGSYGLSDQLAAEVTVGGVFGLGTTLHDQRTDTGVSAAEARQGPFRNGVARRRADGRRASVTNDRPGAW
jgi:hypothetical protein